MPTILNLNEDQIAALLDWPSLIAVLESALIEYSVRPACSPVRQILSLPAQDAFFGVMAAVCRDVLGAKLVTVYPGNAAHHLPTHMGTIQLFRATTGEPIANLDARLITEMRTAAVSAIATRLLAKPDAQILAILGSGVQAKAHLKALRLVRNFTQVYIWSRTPAHALRFAEETGAVPASAENAVRNADIVVTATHAPEPVLSGGWLKSDVHVNAIGAVGASRRELDASVFENASVIVESREAAAKEAGDVLLAGASIYAELGELLAGTKPAPQNHRTVYKALGIGIEDIATARLIYMRSAGVTAAP